ncbi:putative lipid-binding transport protein (Tim44 family) [Kitasatospora sp. MAA4]|uniref:divisome protein SepX/GlpR n=1 Tax=Kitasatospora sp. MAA4 TaxID=3035093 RepID=UPI002473D789|nr:gephyrin-like molybdotransferase receptor GlpR [Kitasatospora sp. MAA4]MDH6134077.1 putative lipid-binding transport protein (Tim44 family) [Kitasatospora sp. MAA4]
MSSSGLIYAVIVGAWAAYLVPMWLRRQDELNEARPTERFSTAIRLLAGRSAMERRASRALNDNDPSLDDPSAPPTTASTSSSTSSAATPSSLAAAAESDDEASGDAPSPDGAPAAPSALPAPSPRGDRRAQLLARRRRMVTVLFLAFAVGAVVAAVAGFDFLWVPGLPALLLTLYIGHLRRLERQRYEVKLDRSRAAQAAQRLREREQARAAALAAPAEPAQAPEARPHLRVAAAPEPASSSRQALVEATDHEEWVDGLRERGAAGPDSWEPVPVPLPTYVTAPVAPRVTRGLDLGAPGTWSSGRPTEARRTPLFDQYEDPAPADAPRPRAANE